MLRTGWRCSRLLDTSAEFNDGRGQFSNQRKLLLSCWKLMSMRNWLLEQNSITMS